MFKLLACTIFLTVTSAFAVESIAGRDDVTIRREIIGAKPSGAFVVVDHWSVINGASTREFPMFMFIHKSDGKVSEAVELPALAGLARTLVGTLAYQDTADKKYEEQKLAILKKGYTEEGIVKIETELNFKGYATIKLPDGRSIEERGTELHGKKKELQKERIDLWLVNSKGEAIEIRANAIQVGLRSRPSTFHIQSAYWLAKSKTVVALYDDVPQSKKEQDKTLWMWRE